MSLSQKPDTPRVVDFWMSALAGITLFSAVFPTLSLHRTLESVCPPSVNPVKGLCETGSIGNVPMVSPNIRVSRLRTPALSHEPSAYQSRRLVHS